MIQGFPEVSKYKVMVQCCTFNQSQYIEDTLKGFAMQQTNFSFVCCIFDDASTDGEPEVLKRWIENHCNPENVKVYNHPLTVILMAPDKDNSNCIYAIHLQKVNTWGKPVKVEMMAHWEKQCEYIALCEGDDYWIDPLKLQKQVDFLNANPEYSFCHTGFHVFEQSKNEFIDNSDIIKRNTMPYINKLDIMEDILDGNKYRIQTMTAVVRLSEYYKAIEKLKPYEGLFLMGDTQLWLSLLSFGNVFFMPDITAVYRINEGSACHSKSIQSRIRFALSCAEMRVVMADLFELNFDAKKKYQSQYQKKLNLYLAYNANYENFVPIKYNNVFEYLRFQFLKLPIMRAILRNLYHNI